MSRHRFDHHPPCPGGCGELADECMTPGCGSPLGSMTIEPPIGSAILCGNTCGHDHESANGPTGCCPTHGPYMYYCWLCAEARSQADAT